MNIDIVEKLFPNLLTIATQLAATFVIYLLYKKFVHVHVLAYLAKRQQFMDAATLAAAEAEQAAKAQQADLQVQRQAMLAKITELEKQLQTQAEAEYQAKLAQAEQLISQQKAAALADIEAEKRKMQVEIKQFASELAFDMSKKVLAGYQVSDEFLLNSLKDQLERFKA